MSKPDGIPDDVWGMTEKIRNQPYHWKGPMEVAIIVAHAIMAERERCAGILEDNHTIISGESADPMMSELIAAIRDQQA